MSNLKQAEVFIKTINEKVCRNEASSTTTAIALYGSWGVLVRTLEHRNETNNTAKAREILKKIEQFNICSISCHAT